MSSLKKSLQGREQSRRNELITKLSAHIRKAPLKKKSVAKCHPGDGFFLSSADQIFWNKIVMMHDGSLPEVTPFQRKVYVLCSRIPPGKVTTYGAMAQVLVSSARAVGQALRHNPYAPLVPCHRVIASTFYIGGFQGQWGSESPTVGLKVELLRKENVVITDGFVHANHCMQDPTIIAALPLPLQEVSTTSH